LAAAGALATVPSVPWREARTLTLECEDEQRLTDRGGPDDVLPDVTTQQDWFRARFVLVPLNLRDHAQRERFDIELAEFVHETERDDQRTAQRWPERPAPPQRIGSAERPARTGEWRVRLHPGAAARIPVAIDELFLARTLGALVVPDGTDRRSGSPVVTRTGRWRRVGGVDFRASIRQVWTIGSANPAGLVLYGWRGEMKILDPDAPIGGAAAGGGTAAELGSFDPVDGMYQDLAQSWDVDFVTAGARIAWRHRCSTSVELETPAPRTGNPR